MKSIKFEKITFGYDTHNPLFQNLSFELSNRSQENGHIIALMGSSGAGKSTILKLILGISMPQAGNIVFTPSNPVIAYLPQEPVLFEHLSPMENARYFSYTAAYKQKFDETLFQELVVSLNMQEVLHQSKSVLKLSGGQRQRLSLLRSLSIRPDFLLLDEPTTGLDAEVKLQFLNKLREIVLKQNLLVIYITHQKLETELLVDEIVYLFKNEADKAIHKVFQAELTDFIKNPPVLEAVNIFNYPKPNLLKCSLENQEVRLDFQEQNFVFIKFDDAALRVSAESGLLFKVITSNPIYALIELDVSKQLLSLSVSSLGTDYRLLLNGRAEVYDKTGLYLKTIYLNNNNVNH